MPTNPFNLFWPIFKNKIIPRNIPYFCTYIVTWRCNARCKMCHIWKKKKSPEMSLPEIDKVFREISKIRVVRLTGGEPFVRKDLMEIASIIIKNTSTQILHVTTNGTLKDEIVHFIKNVKHKNIHLKISLNGYMRRHDEIMGVKGAYKKAIETIEALKSIQDKDKFFLAINQTITDWDSYQDSKKIRALCKDYKLSYLPVVAYKSVPLYESQKDEKNPETDFVPYEDFRRDELQTILEDLLAETNKINNFIEKLVKKYYLTGLYNRLVFNKKHPKPKCVALRNHIRILPNGDIPVCLYNSRVAGNLLEDDFSSVWDGPEIKRLRNWVDRCQGCWAECETIPNAVFSGGLITNPVIPNPFE